MQDMMQKILAKQTLKPILAKHKSIERKLEADKLDHKARRALVAEKKSLRDYDHVLPDPVRLDTEKRLRKIATRGGTWYM